VADAREPLAQRRKTIMAKHSTCPNMSDFGFADNHSGELPSAAGRRE